MFTRILFSWAIVCSALLGGRISALAFTTNDADTIINSFNGAYYDSSTGIYARNQSGGTADFWKFAEMIEMHVDVYERSPTANNFTILTNLVNGFDTAEGTDWSWNGFNDDVMWAVMAHCRAYQKTGNQTYRAIAKANFDMAYARGWDTSGAVVPPVGGFFWNTSNNSKNSAVNCPAVIAAYLLYQTLGDAAYYTKATNIFAWVTSNLADTNTGLVYDSLSNHGPTTYNQGTFIGGANFLGLTNYARLAANYLMTMGSTNATSGGYRLMPNYDPGGDVGGFNGIGIRWVTKFMNDNGLQSFYLPWLQTNAQAAWNVRRLSDNLSWDMTQQQTAVGSNLWSFGCSPAVVAMAKIPPTQSAIAPAIPTGLAAAQEAQGVTLNWIASSPGYNVKRSTTPGGSYTTIGTATFNSYTDNTVAGNTTYYYVVSAVNSLGESGDSAEANIVSPDLSDVKREPVADTYVRSGSSANNNFGTDSVLIAKLDTTDLTRNAFLRFDVSGMANARSIKLQLVVHGVSSQPDTTTLAFEFISNDAWNETGMTWNNKPAGSGIVFTNITGFAVGQVVEVDVTSQAKIQAAGDGLLSIKIYGTVAGTGRYVDFMSRENADTNSHPVLAFWTNSVTPLPPAIPTGLSATPISPNQINLSWNTSSGSTGYQVKRATVNNGPYITVATNLPTTVYSDLGLSANTTYYYVVSGTNAGGESANSIQATATTPATLPLVTLTNGDSSSQASFTSVGNWNNGAAPSSANEYLVRTNYVLRTPTSGSASFPGHSLTLSNSAVLSIKTTSTVTIGTNAATGVFLDNGWIANWTGGATPLNGFITLASGGGGFDPQTFAILTVSAPITGVGGVKIGVRPTDTQKGGTIVLATNNTYTGGTAITSADTLRLSGSGALGDSAGPFVFVNTNGFGFGTLDLNGTSQAIGNLSGTGGVITNLSVTDSTLTIGNGNNGGGIFQGLIMDGTGRIALIKTGSGTITLSAANTYKGGTTISDGTLKLGDGTAHNGSVAGNITNLSTLIIANPSAQNCTNALSGSGSFVKSGSGTLTLSGANALTGDTIISAGTVALTQSASFSNSETITVSTGATLNVNGLNNQMLTLNSGQLLSGSGTLVGNLNALAGSTVNPGDAIGTLSVQGNVALAGTLVIEINRTNAQTSDRLVSISGSITGGGTLSVINLGPAAQAGDVFQIFNQPVGGFSSMDLPDLNSPLVWTNRLSIDGTLQVVAPIATNSTNITAQASGNGLSISWPADHVGWRLQAQTNGLGTNWFDVTDSAATNLMMVPIDPANGSVFFRLVSP